MSTAEAVETAEAREPSGRIKFSSPRQLPIVGVVTEDEEVQVWPGVCALEGVKEWAGVEIWGRGRCLGAVRAEVGARVETRAAHGTQVPNSKLILRTALPARGVGCRQSTCLGLMSRGPPGSSRSVQVN